MHKKLIPIILSTSLALASSSFNAIHFKGLSQISEDIALELSNFNANEPYSDKKINKAIKEFYNFGYFKDIIVSSENRILTFDFIEKPFIVKLEMTGYKTREDDLEILYNEMNIKKGNMYSPQKIEKAKDKLITKLEQEGYINSVVEIEIDNINSSSVVIKFIVNKGDEIIIKTLNYRGAKQIDIDDFEDVTHNKEKDSFSWFFGQNDGVINFDQLEYDGLRIKEVYMKNGFLDAKIQHPFSKIDFNINTAIIDIDIDEGQQYKVNSTVIYLDEKIVDPKTIYPNLKLQKNKIVNIEKLKQDIEFIKTQVSDKGYAFTKVKYDIRKNTKDGIVDIIYNVTPGEKVYINDVIISGNNRTLDRVIRRNVYLAPKDLFNLTDFKDSQNALNRTGFFETIKIEQQRISKNKMDLIVTVVEAATGSLVFGGGYGSYDGLMLNASINDKNIYGSGLDIGFSLDLSSKQANYNISVKNPALNDSKYSGSAAIYNKETEITEDDDSTLTTNSTGTSIGIGKALTRHTHIGTVYSINQTSATYDTKPQDNHSYIISSLTPYINYNNTDSYFNPRNGNIAKSSLEIAGLGGDVTYLKSSTSYKYFKGLEDQLNFDAIIRYRATIKILQSSGYAPISNSFYLGGPSTVRGYKSYAFGPSDDENPYERMFANSIELSLPLIPDAKMRWGLFYDYGMIGQSTFTQIKRSGTGGLIEWISPMGPLQFIFSKALDAQPGDNTSSFEFSLGSMF